MSVRTNAREKQVTSVYITASVDHHIKKCATLKLPEK